MTDCLAFLILYESDRLTSTPYDCRLSLPVPDVQGAMSTQYDRLSRLFVFCIEVRYQSVHDVQKTVMTSV